MARPTARLISLLRQTASRLAKQETKYQWSHFGHCNCGHLVQTLTGMNAHEILEHSSECAGDWGAEAKAAERPVAHPRPDFGDRPALDEGAWEPENVGACVVTGTRLDLLLDRLYAVGLASDDIGHLERLSDPAVRRRLGTNTQEFLHFERDNVIAYMRAWADLLEEHWLVEQGAHQQDAALLAAAE